MDSVENYVVLMYDIYGRLMFLQKFRFADEAEAEYKARAKRYKAWKVQLKQRKGNNYYEIKNSLHIRSKTHKTNPYYV